MLQNRHCLQTARLRNVPRRRAALKFMAGACSRNAITELATLARLSMDGMCRCSKHKSPIEKYGCEHRHILFVGRRARGGAMMARERRRRRRPPERY